MISKKIITRVILVEDYFIKYLQNKFTYESIYPLIQISKYLTKTIWYNFYFALILLADPKKFLLNLLVFRLTRFLTNSIKLIVKQPRPYNINPTIVRYYKKRKWTLSFPSQSMASIVLVYQLLNYYYSSLLITIYFGNLIFLLAFTRIYRGLHYPRDILASYLIPGLLLKYYLKLIA